MCRHRFTPSSNRPRSGIPHDGTSQVHPLPSALGRQHPVTTISRRDAVRTAAAIVVSLPLISACRGLSRGDFPGADLTDDATVPDPVVRDILRHAALAPSGHNTQPWTVRIVDPVTLVVGSAAARLLPAVDPTGREMLLSIGAFTENLVQAAAFHGWLATPEVIATTSAERDILRVRLTRCTPSTRSLESMRRRRTVRSHQRSRSITPADSAALLAQVPGALIVQRGSAVARTIEDATLEANIQQTARDDAQRELSHWIRFSDADGRHFRNGLTPESMEIGGLKGVWVRHMMDSSSVTGQSFRNSGIDTVREQLASYGAWVIVTSSDGAVGTLIETGRAWQRMLLGARERSVAVHPMTQALEESRVGDQLLPRLGVDGAVQFILRIGYVDSYPEPVSLRMPLSSFVTTTPAA